NSWKSLLPHSKTHFDVRGSRRCYRVDVGIFCRWIKVFARSVLKSVYGRHHERFVFIPSHFVFTKPKGTDFHTSLWTFVRVAVLFLLGTPHQELTALNRYHLVGSAGLRDLCRVVGEFHLGLCTFDDLLANFSHQRQVVRIMVTCGFLCAFLE